MKFATAFAVVSAVAPVALSKEIVVYVGASQADNAPGLVFDPQQITADVGDTVAFQFRGGNHTVTQSSLANPCAWQFNTALQENGFNSDFVPFDAASGEVGVYTVEVTQTTTPIWFFCGRPPHCKGGMFGAINAPAERFETFKANVESTDEPGLGVTVPFTPPNAANPSASGGVSGTPTTLVATGPLNTNGPAPTNSGTNTAPNNGTLEGAAPTGPAPGGAAFTISARSAVVVGAIGTLASLLF